MKYALVILALLALIAIGGTASAQVWYPYPDSYNYNPYYVGVYGSGDWYGNQYTATIAGSNVYDHWGNSYGNYWTDYNSANWGYGSWWSY